jgi:hypothetical protein
VGFAALDVCLGLGIRNERAITKQHPMERKCYLSSSFAITMRWIWLVPS